jgi:carbon monoxide dehydrogenase subunit G
VIPGVKSIEMDENDFTMYIKTQQMPISSKIEILKDFLKDDKDVIVMAKS